MSPLLFFFELLTPEPPPPPPTGDRRSRQLFKIQIAPFFGSLPFPLPLLPSLLLNGNYDMEKWGQKQNPHFWQQQQKGGRGTIKRAVKLQKLHPPPAKEKKEERKEGKKMLVILSFSSPHTTTLLLLPKKRVSICGGPRRCYYYPSICVCVCERARQNRQPPVRLPSLMRLGSSSSSLFSFPATINQSCLALGPPPLQTSSHFSSSSSKVLSFRQQRRGKEKKVLRACLLTFSPFFSFTKSAQFNKTIMEREGGGGGSGCLPWWSLEYTARVALSPP